MGVHRRGDVLEHQEWRRDAIEELAPFLGQPLVGLRLQEFRFQVGPAGELDPTSEQMEFVRWAPGGLGFDFPRGHVTIHNAGDELAFLRDPIEDDLTRYRSL